MKAIKIGYVLFLLALLEVFLTYSIWDRYHKQMQSGKIQSLAEMADKRLMYLGLVPIILGPIGVVVRRKIGWAFTASLFYLISILTVAAGYKNRIDSWIDWVVYTAILGIIISPLIIMNGKDFKVFFKLDPAITLRNENITTFLFMTAIAIALIIKNG